MNFGPILTDLELFIGRVPERAKTIIINMGIKIPLIFDIRPEFLRESNSLTYIKIRRKEDHKCKVKVILGP